MFDPAGVSFPHEVGCSEQPLFGYGLFSQAVQGFKVGKVHVILRAEPHIERLLFLLDNSLDVIVPPPLLLIDISSPRFYFAEHVRYSIPHLFGNPTADV